jgi:hypothetical protein
MAIQDLTPQLRTRLSRVERAVGWFVLLATLLMLAGFGYYVHHTLQRKGVFLTKITYQTGVANAAGLAVGNKVKLMGFDVGEITKIEANDPWAYYNTTVYFQIREPYFGYLWSDSLVKVAAADFLGNRNLEVTKGRYGLPTVDEEVRTTTGWFPRTNRVAVGVLDRDYMDRLKQQGREPAQVFKEKRRLFYRSIEPGVAYWLEPEETPAITERFDQLARMLNQKGALGDLLVPTNLNARLDLTLASLQGVIESLTNRPGAAGELLIPTNTLAELDATLHGLKGLTASLNAKPGAVGELLFPTNLVSQLETTLARLNSEPGFLGERILPPSTITNLNLSLAHLSGVASNLHAQVDANTALLSQISSLITNTDLLIQGLKRHWFLRSAFQSRTNRPSLRPITAKGATKL